MGHLAGANAARIEVQIWEELVAHVGGVEDHSVVRVDDYDKDREECQDEAEIEDHGIVDCRGHGDEIPFDPVQSLVYWDLSFQKVVEKRISDQVYGER